MNDDAGLAAELLGEAYNMPQGEERYSKVCEAVRHAEVAGDEDLLFEARLELVSASTFTGRAQETFTAFAWCLAKFKEDPYRYDYYSRAVLWSFKFILHNADEIPGITREQFEQLSEQMAEIYQQYGYNLRPVYYLRFLFASSTGDFDAASVYYEKFQTVERDMMADCLACEADTTAEYLARLGQFERAAESMANIISNGMQCATVPQRTYSKVLHPLAMLGRYEEADANQRKGYSLIRYNPVFLAHAAFHLAYLRHRGKLDEALDLIQNHLHWALDTTEQRSRYLFYCTAAQTLELVADDVAPISLRLPKTFEKHRPDGRYDPAELAGWFNEQARELGERFDRRNQNNYFTTTLRERLRY